MAIRGKLAWKLLGQVKNENAKKEYYLTDIVGLAGAAGRSSAVIETGADEVAGVNSRGELAGVEGAWQAQRRAQALALASPPQHAPVRPEPAAPPHDGRPRAGKF